jgi:DNA ligase (NAD+)
VEVDRAQRDPLSEAFRFTSRCPECGTTLVRKEDEAAHYCPNGAGCPPQIKGRIEHFISRRAMDINAAEATIDLLYRERLISDVADLYTLDFESLVGLERFGTKSSQNLLASIQVSKKVPFPRVLYALGIRYVGETVARKLADAFLTMDQLMAATHQSLVEVDEIGERIAQSVRDYFEDPINLELVRRLRDYGLQFETDIKKKNVDQLLTGKSFVISGVFESHSRDELKTLIEQYGGRYAGSISSKTDYVLAGENMGPSKYEKARQLGLPIITESEFLSMIS